jgi:hypothetical protein
MTGNAPEHRKNLSTLGSKMETGFNCSQNKIDLSDFNAGNRTSISAGDIENFKPTLS